MSLGLSIKSHHFCGGVYAKKVIIEDGFEIKQHAHEYDHMSILSEGCAVVFQGDEQKTYYAGDVIEIPAGVEHSVCAVNGRVVWFCIHKTDETDVDNIDNVLIEKQKNMIDTGLIVNVDNLLSAINDNPQLWNQYTLRTENADSPHHGCDDIWIRFNDFKNYDPNNPQAFYSEHESVWYQNEISSKVSEMVLRLTPSFGSYKTGVQLGGILITRIPAGGKVLRHNDAGRWHAEYYKDKFLIPLMCDEKQSFNFDGESHITEVGHVYKFNNLADHWVDNDSDKERISLIICMKLD